MSKSVKIYLSFILIVRDDNYGGNLRNRINNWVNHIFEKLSIINSEIELIIVNWNPPQKNSSITDWIDLKKVKNYKIITVSPGYHQKYAFNYDRPVLDYIARNKGVSVANGEFVCIINQDIYLSNKIFELIQKKEFDYNLFYRADRCDISKIDTTNQQVIENGECNKTKTIHRRHKDNEPISLELEKPQVLPACSVNNSLYFDLSITHKEFLDSISELKIENLPNLNQILIQSGLHTNASGDFIILSKKNFERSTGFCETALFYLHLDTYFIVQLWVMGLRQALLPHTYHVFHLEHDRTERLNRIELFNWSQHEIILLSIIYGIIPFKLNGR